MKINQKTGTLRLIIATILLAFTARIATGNAQMLPPVTIPVQTSDSTAFKLADLLDPNICTNSLSPTAATYGSAGGNGAVTVTTGSACTWTAASNAAWITITQGSTGMGTETIAYTVTANPAATTRTATLTIAGNPFTVTQSGGATQLTLPQARLSLASPPKPPPL